MDLLITITEEMVMKVNASCGCSRCAMVKFMILKETEKASSRAKGLA